MEAGRDELNIRFGKLLARRRRARGLSQAALAAKAEISVTTVSQIESGTFNPSFQMIKTLSSALKYDASSFFSDKLEFEDSASKIIREIVVAISPLKEKRLLEIRDVILAMVKR